MTSLSQSPRKGLLDVPDRDPQISQGGSEGGRTERLLPVLHVKDVIYRRGEWWPNCTCGWTGMCWSTRDQAEREECEVEAALAASAYRRERFLKG